MDLKASKIELMKLILNTNNKELIAKVYGLFKTDLSSTDSEEFTNEQIEEIELGLKQLDDGERISFKDFLEKVS